MSFWGNSFLAASQPRIRSEGRPTIRVDDPAEVVQKQGEPNPAPGPRIFADERSIVPEAAVRMIQCEQEGDFGTFDHRDYMRDGQGQRQTAFCVLPGEVRILSVG